MIATELFGSYISAAGGDAGGQTTEGAEHMSTVFREGVVERLAHQPDEFIADLIFTAEEQSQIAEIMTSIGTYQTECLTAFISGSMDLDSGWDNYVNTLKAMGLDTYISTAQTAYTRMMG